MEKYTFKIGQFDFHNGEELPMTADFYLVEDIDKLLEENKRLHEALEEARKTIVNFTNNIFLNTLHKNITKALGDNK